MSNEGAGEELEFGPAALPQAEAQRLEQLRWGGGEVQLWTASLEASQAAVQALGATLSTDEQERAARFRFERHRRQYVVSRGLLRRLLAAYLGRPAAAVRFVYGSKGKPSLADEGERRALQFNVAHSGERVLIGFTAGTPLGVDIEELRPMPDAEDIARSFFSQCESADLGQVSSAQKSEAFFNCWTRKEAYVKATGDGLSVPLDRFDLTLLPGQEARFLRLDGSEEKAARWTLRHLQPARGYIGALAIEKHGLAIRSWTLDTESITRDPG